DLPGLRRREGRLEYVVVPATYSGTGRSIVITETDIDNVMRAKAALYAGVSTLLRLVDLDWPDLARVYVAGAFGRHVRLDQAMAIGLFPELKREKFCFLGNGSLQGAKLVALDRSQAVKARQIAARMENIELTDNVLFGEEYMAALFLPHTDLSRFPRMHRLLERSVS
ncbi:MAG: DUF4445 domain-containing protein, partial [Thermoleophilia bacterium]|nr:DUF4445 domain-containing protein [Thermoleophilia bacterium]